MWVQRSGYKLYEKAKQLKRTSVRTESGKICKGQGEKAKKICIFVSHLARAIDVYQSKKTA